MKRNYDYVALGQGHGCMYSTDSSKTGVNNNVLVCAGTGAGKTMSITEPRLLNTFNSSLIATVTKRRIVAKYKPMFLHREYNVQDLDFVHPQNCTVGFDPLAYVRSYADISALSEALVQADPRKKNCNADPYWDHGAEAILSAMTSYVLMSKKCPTFNDVLDMLDKLEVDDGGDQIKTSYDQLFQQLEEKDPSCFAVRCWKSFRNLPLKTASCMFSTLNTELCHIFTPEVRKIIAMKDHVDFEALASKKTVLFITSSPVNPALHTFVHLFYSYAFKELFEFGEAQKDGALPIPVHLICDDFATGARIINFEQYISVFREKGISVSLMLQSESQLSAMYGTEQATTIINNCDTYIFMGGNDLQTAKNISLKLNAPLEDVLYMPVGQEIIFRRGQRPIITTRYDILNDAVYQRVTKEYEKSLAAAER